jgi:hypothetical protein
MSTDDIYVVANQRDVPLPAAVVEADKLASAARALRDKVHAETAPDLGGVTTKNLAATHAAIVAWENRDARLSAAEALVKHADDVLANARFIHHHELFVPLGELFDRAGRDFMLALLDLGGHIDVSSIATSPVRAEAYARLTTAAAELDQLSRARGEFSPRGSRAVTVSDLFEEVSRCLVVSNYRSLARNPIHVGRGIDHWAEAVRRGYVIKWQSKAEQEQNSRDAMKAQSGSTAYSASASA